jgi:hypothetical protein
LLNKKKANTVSTRIMKVDIDRCEPMPEIRRRFYDQANVSYLQSIIFDEGFKECYAVRAIRNSQTKQYEIFDGCHRLEAVKANYEKGGPYWIYLIDETDYLTRTMAIAEGIKANKTHAAYNPIDIAYNLQSLSRKFQAEAEKGKTRPYEKCLQKTAEATKLSVDQVSSHLSLLKLPPEVIVLIGSGKLKKSHGIELLRLPKEKMVAVADECYKEQWSVVTLKKRINGILSGNETEKKVCQGCENVYDLTMLTKTMLCPKCIDGLHKGDLNIKAIDEHKKAEQKYLHYNAIVERLYPQQKPPIVQNYLARFHKEWRGN